MSYLKKVRQQAEANRARTEREKKWDARKAKRAEAIKDRPPRQWDTHGNPGLPSVAALKAEWADKKEANRLRREQSEKNRTRQK